jgi:hypothetical protein
MTEGPEMNQMMTPGTCISDLFHVYEKQCNGIRFFAAFIGRQMQRSELAGEHANVRVIFSDPSL